MTELDEDLSPARLAEFVLRTLPDLGVFGAFWYRVIGDRQRYAAELSAVLQGEPVIVLQVRDVRFDNPNAVLDDLVVMLERNREDCERAVHGAAKCAAILLARTELNLPHVTSPVELPAWFPAGGGTTVSTRILDVTWIGDAPLNCAEARVPELCAGLFRLERELLLRLTTVHANDKGATNALLDHLRTDTTESFADIVKKAEAAIASVANPDGFRPTLRTCESVVARLWSSAQTQNPDALGRIAKALATALKLPSGGTFPPDTLATVMRRPTSPISESDRRCAFNLICTIAASAQLTTAAAHADGYPSFPVTLIRALSYDLRRGLAELSGLLAELR